MGVRVPQNGGCLEEHDAPFQFAPLGPVLAPVLRGLGALVDARAISIAGRSTRKGTSHGTPDLLSHDTDRWALHLLSRGRPQRRADDSLAARTSLIIADVRTSLLQAFRPLSPCRARLPGFRKQRLAGPEEICLHLRSLR